MAAPHSAERYARNVVAGKIIACKWVKLACQRHVNDRKHGHKRGLYFDERAAQRALDFLSVVKHFEGEWSGHYYQPSDWQIFCTWALFGWMRAKHKRWIVRKRGLVEDSSGTRRFRTGFIEVARKNGKTFWAAAIGNYLAFADGEDGAEVYSAATKRDQARIAYQKAKKMVQRSPMLRRHIRVFKDNLNSQETGSKYEPLGADADTTDGLDVYGVIADELHAWKSREMWDVLETGTGSRRQPLMLAITTAGSDRNGICWQFHDYTQKVLEGIIDDDTWFGLIFTIDKGDDWRDEDAWPKANPNLGISKKWDDMRRKADRAKKMPTQLNAFQQKELNMWVKGDVKWMNLEAWRRCAGDVPALELPAALEKRTSFGGLDLGSTSDLSSMVHVFPADDGFYDVVARFWLPEDAIQPRTQEGTNYDLWVQQGYITRTDGNTIDTDFILDQVEKDADLFEIQHVAFDRWGAARVVQVLEKKGLTMVQFGQGYASMSPPMRELERLVLQGKLRHGNNPVLTWMADNLVASMDPAGNIKPDKQKSKEKIDGMVALIMALDGALRNAGKTSVYEKRGIRTVG
jgi:phage terminase large subunit-like protein